MGPDVNIAQWLGSTAPTVGQKTKSESIPVVLASDQSPIPVSTSGGARVFPFDGNADDPITYLNVGHIHVIGMLIVSPTAVLVKFYMAVPQYNTPVKFFNGPAATVDAQAYIDLWIQRINDAK